MTSVSAINSSTVNNPENLQARPAGLGATAANLSQATLIKLQRLHFEVGEAIKSDNPMKGLTPVTTRVSHEPVVFETEDNIIAPGEQDVGRALPQSLFEEAKVDEDALAEASSKQCYQIDFDPALIERIEEGKDSSMAQQVGKSSDAQKRSQCSFECCVASVACIALGGIFTGLISGIVFYATDRDKQGHIAVYSALGGIILTLLAIKLATHTCLAEKKR